MMSEKIIQITSGRGPAECCWVVAQILKYMLIEAKDFGLNCTILNREEGIENGTLFSAAIQLEGSGVEEFIKKWIGTVQWTGQSKFRKHHKRKNWFVGVNELEMSNESNELNGSDLKFEATRAGGPGGQHVNKVSTAIRVTHVSTGLSVLASDSRSQLQNRKKAKERLLAILKVRQLEDRKNDIKNNWNNHNELERGNPVRIFKGSDFKSNYVDKNYKSKRQLLKRDLKQLPLDD
jgi:peptide chain release factor